MRENGHGHIVNVSSVGVRVVPGPQWGAYQASKGAFDRWLRSVAPELHVDGVDVTTVYFALVRTPDDRAHARPGQLAGSVTPTRPRTRSPKPSSTTPHHRPALVWPPPNWLRCCWPGPPIAPRGCGTAGSSPNPVAERPQDDVRQASSPRGLGHCCRRAARTAQPDRVSALLREIYRGGTNLYTLAGDVGRSMAGPDRDHRRRRRAELSRRCGPGPNRWPTSCSATVSGRGRR